MDKHVTGWGMVRKGAGDKLETVRSQWLRVGRVAGKAWRGKQTQGLLWSQVYDALYVGNGGREESRISRGFLA